MATLFCREGSCIGREGKAILMAWLTYARLPQGAFIIGYPDEVLGMMMCRQGV
jgi:hypothetical protein